MPLRPRVSSTFLSNRNQSQQGSAGPNRKHSGGGVARRIRKFTRKIIPAGVSGAMAAASILGMTTPAAAATVGPPLGISFDGSCTAGSPVLVRVNIQIAAGELNNQDVDLGPGFGFRDVYVIYVVDSANRIIGREAQSVPTGGSIGSAQESAARVSQPLTAPGNVRIYVTDETDFSPDQADGATFTNTSVIGTGAPFDLVALDADCAFVAGDTTPPRISSITRNSPASSPTNSDSVSWSLVFNEAVQNVSMADFTRTGTTAALSVSGTGTNYTVSLTGGDLANSNNLVTLGFSGSQNIQDTSGNALTNTTPTGSDIRTFQMDNTGPTISGFPATNLTPSQVSSSSFTLTFSEGVTGFASGDISVTNGSVTSFSGSGTTYNVTVTPSTNNGTMTTSIGANVATDGAGNGNASSPGFHLTVDNLAPSVSLVPDVTGTTNAASITYTVTFSESVTGFTGADLRVANGIVSGFTGSETSYSFNLAPIADGDVSVNIDASAASDTAGNPSTAAPPHAAITSDRTGPTVTLSTTAPNPTNLATIPVTVALSENVSDFVAGDVSVTNGSVSGFGGSGSSYSFSVIPTGNGTVTVSVASNVMNDAVGNDNTASNTLSVVSDRSAPGATVSTTGPDPTNTASIPVTVSFTENVTGLTAGDVLVTNGLASDFSGSGTTYTFNVTPAADGVVTVSVAAGLATDSAGNTNTLSNLLSVVSDRTSPGLTLSTTAPDPTNLALIPITATFSESVTGFAAGDIVVGNGSVSGFSGSGSVYTFNVIPAADGTVTVDVAADAAQDGATNGNTAAAQLSRISDRSGPSATIATTVPNPFNTPTIPVTVTFSDAVTGFDAGDVSVGNGTVSGFTGSGTTYSFTVTPTADGLVTIDVAGNAGQDSAGNGNSAATQLSRTSDQTDPTVTISGTPAFPGSPYTITITFSEAVTGLTLGDFTTSNVDLTGLAGSDTTYTATATATGLAHSIQLPPGSATDAANNGNAISNLFANTPDGVAPTITITGLPATYGPGDVFNVTFTFSEAVSGFDSSDITVAGGALSAFAGGPSVFTATITPGGTTNVTINVADGAATDVSGQGSSAASATSSLSVAEIASELISDFLDQRARNLVQAQPGLTGFLRNGVSAGGSANVTRGRGTFDLHTGDNLPLWVAASGSWSESSTGSDTNYMLGVIGAHHQFSSNLSVGGMLQFDYSETNTNAGATAAGTGWLVGPYLVAKLRDQPLYLEARLLWGRTDNEVSPVGTFTDQFSGERWLAMLGVTGEYETDFLTVLPNVTLSHVEDRQDAYIDSLSNLVPEQSIAITELAIGLDFEAPFILDSGLATLTWGVSGIWSSVNGDGAASAFVSDVSDARVRLDLGYRYSGDRGMSANVGAFADGLGSRGTQTYGLEAGLQFSF
ncbi:MAG: hypothetical protein JJ949_12570 [Roseicyclus sp.]|nr:hypothetical protein [Roseicyclus sp.]MBO6924269.1 hypothetical protein [Roseicyclus sp.]